MTKISTNRRLKFDDRVQLLAALFKEFNPTTEQLEDIVTCFTMAEIKEYMSDIGITYTQTTFGFTIHQTSVGQQGLWVTAKVQMLFKFLNDNV